MRKPLFIFICSICLLFISCGGDIKVSIFTRDLSDIASEKEKVIYTNVNMIVESLDDANDINFLRNNLNGFSNEHQVEYNYSTSLSFDIKIPIIMENTDIDSSKDLLILIGKKNGNRIDFYLKYNKQLFSKIDKYIYNAHYQNIDLKEFNLKFDVNNDERKSVSFTTYSSYVNGKAYPFEHLEILRERDRISFEVSEIFSKYISEMTENSFPLFSIQ